MVSHPLLSHFLRRGNATHRWPPEPRASHSRRRHVLRGGHLPRCQEAGALRQRPVHGAPEHLPGGGAAGGPGQGRGRSSGARGLGAGRRVSGRPGSRRGLQVEREAPPGPRARGGRRDPAEAAGPGGLTAWLAATHPAARLPSRSWVLPAGRTISSEQRSLPGARRRPQTLPVLGDAIKVGKQTRWFL